MEFSPGLNILTGETGAGKSILMGALSLLLGERADKSSIRSGEEMCMAEASFTLPSTDAVDSILRDYGVEPCAGGELVIRRVIRESGAGRNIVNDGAVTLQVLKRLGQEIVDMHGPYDHQSLLRMDAQLHILDAFGGLAELRSTYTALYREIRALEERKEALQTAGEHIEEQIDLLSYRVKEIEEAALEEGEEEKIEEEHRIAGNAQRILELLGGLLTALSDGEGAAFDAMAGAQGKLDELIRLLPEAESWREELRGLTAHLQELCATMSTAASRIEADPDRLEWLDRRLTVYQKMKRKYGSTVSEVLEALRGSKERLHDLETRGEQRAALERELESNYSELSKIAATLRKKRQSVATQLASAVTEELRELGFAHGAFSIELKEVEPHGGGIDRIEFGFAPNAGEPCRPLRAIASSGEISRVMLATKSVLAKQDSILVLVFDEIDANVGGEIGTAIGRKLTHVAEHHQVICITHLPHVAVYGGTHHVVTKEVRDQRTFTRVERVEGESRVEEVARMLGGREMTSVTLDHARKMLEGG